METSVENKRNGEKEGERVEIEQEREGMKEE
jgi:hypothetical protein